MNEKELIRKLTSKLPTNQNTILSVGDDCAAVRPPAENEALLLKTDAVVENVHFTRDDKGEGVGRKALGRCLSDIAAMAGVPESALITVGLAGKDDEAFVESVYEGLSAMAKEYDVAIVGGETTRNPGGLFISVALTGRVRSDGGVQRGGAQVGDAIFVSGALGGSLAGGHLDFVPRLKEAQWLDKTVEIRAMIDVSDGLATDLGHILKASGVGALIDESFLPISRAAKFRARENESAKTPLLAALTDGEDFELLFTVAPSEAVRLKDSWREVFPEVPLSVIGRVEEAPGLRLKQANGVRSLGGVDGYDHFE